MRRDSGGASSRYIPFDLLEASGTPNVSLATAWAKSFEHKKHKDDQDHKERERDALITPPKSVKH